METHVKSALDATKEKIRIEISSQVEDFLKRGGQINVVQDPVPESANRGMVWHGNDEGLTLRDLGS